MHRLQIAVLLLALSAPMLAHASVISLDGDGVLLPNTAGQQLTLRLSGTDFYTDSDLKVTINGGVGPAPAVTHLFGNTFGNIPYPNLAGSIWKDGAAGIMPFPNGTTDGSSGLEPQASFLRVGGISNNTAGVYVTLTISTVGITTGDFPLDLTGTKFWNGFTEDFDPIPVPLELPTIVLRVPEPSTYALAAMGLVAVFTARRGTRPLASR